MKNPAGRFETVSPIFGSEMAFFRLGDLPAANSEPVAAITEATTDAQSVVLDLGAQSIWLHVSFSDAVTKATVSVYTVVDAVETLVTAFAALDSTKTEGLFVGGFEGFDLAGKPVKIKVSEVSGGGKVSVTISRNS